MGVYSVMTEIPEPYLDWKLYSSIRSQIVDERFWISAYKKHRKMPLKFEILVSAWVHGREEQHGRRTIERRSKWAQIKVGDVQTQRFF